MKTTTITVAKKKEPQPGRKMWWLTADDGREFMLWPDKAALVEEWKSYEIDYDTKDWQGKQQHTIKNLRPATNMAPKANLVPQERTHNKDREIFVCGITKEWMPQIPVAETSGLVAALKSACEAYDIVFGDVNTVNIEDTF